jgi:uncharacterized protein YrrD
MTDNLTDSTNVDLGDNAIGAGGKLGEVHRMVFDPQSDCVTELVVQRGTILAHDGSCH